MKTLQEKRNTMLAALTLLLCHSPVFAQYNMTPPGPPGSEEARMRTLNELEPRIPISSLPFTITNSGAYFLTGNLAGSNGFDGIVIRCDDVQFDMKGFALNGVPGSSNAVNVAQTSHNISIRNGVVRGWGAAGVNAMNAHESEIVGITAFTNRFEGIRIGENSLVKGCGSFKNLGAGILTDKVATIMDCKTRDNSMGGIIAGAGSRVEDCISNHNGVKGIEAGDFCVVRNCTTAENLGHGMVIKSDSRVLDNASCTNSPSELGAGIYVVGSNSRIEGNNCSRNAEGISFTSDATGNLVVRNNCSNNTSNNYVRLLTPNIYGPIITVSGAITDPNPWANFSF